MSCAVMFQPCLPTESLAVSSAKSEIDSPPQTLLSSPTYQGGASLQNHHDAYLLHQQQQTFLDHHHRFHATKSARRSPLGDEKEHGKAAKKLCTINRESSVPALVSVSDQSDLQVKPHSSPQSIGAPQENPAESNVKYVSANCVVVTHYTGDAASMVDEHFSRALAGKTGRGPESNLKIATRGFPASFYQPQAITRPSLGLGGTFGPHASTDLYEAYHGGLHSNLHPGTDPWTYAFSSQAYSHRAAVGHDMYHSAMASGTHHYQYSSLGLPQHFSRIPSVPLPTQMMKGDSWGSRYYESFAGCADFSSGLDPTTYAQAAHYSHPHHPHNPTGIENGMVSDTSKDHYWL